MGVGSYRSRLRASRRLDRSGTCTQSQFCRGMARRQLDKRLARRGIIGDRIFGPRHASNPFDARMRGMRTGTAYSHFLLGRYEEAASWAAKALQDSPDFPAALRVAAASNAMLGAGHRHTKQWLAAPSPSRAACFQHNRHCASTPRRPSAIRRSIEARRPAGIARRSSRQLPLLARDGHPARRRMSASRREAEDICSSAGSFRVARSRRRRYWRKPT